MRSIPGMTVMCPSDDVEAKQMVQAAYDYEGPCYIRFGRMAVPVYHREDYQFEIGKAEVVRDGADAAILATGLMVHEAMAAAELLEAQGISVRVVNIPTIKPLDEQAVIDAARVCGKIVTVEEHNIFGGLGEAVCSVTAEYAPAVVRRIGVMDQFGHSGPGSELLKQFGLCAEHIAEEVKKVQMAQAG